MFFFHCWRTWSGFVHVAPVLLSLKQKRGKNRLQRHFTQIIVLKIQFVISIRLKKKKIFHEWFQTFLPHHGLFTVSPANQIGLCWPVLLFFQWMYCGRSVNVWYRGINILYRTNAFWTVWGTFWISAGVNESVRCPSRETVLSLENSTCLDTGQHSHLY